MVRTRVDISKFLSLVLRRRPSVIGLTLDDGWANIAELVEKGCKAGVNITPDRIRRVVAVRHSDIRYLFQISEDGVRVRAQHSLVMDRRRNIELGESLQTTKLL